MSSPEGRFGHGRLWSLWDMINFSFLKAHTCLELIGIRERNSLRQALERRKSVLLQFVDDAEKTDAGQFLAMSFGAFEGLNAKRINQRLFRFKDALEREITWEDYSGEYKFLRETIQDELKDHHFYHYEPRFSEMLQGFQENWAKVIEGFPSAEDDAHSAVDCIALEHGTAAVFHLMRVLEYGIAAMANQVNVDWTKDTWHVVLNNIEKAIKAIDESATREARQTRLPFLSKAAAEFRFFKDAWRNHVSHAKSAYDQDQANGIATHVRAFMTVLSENGVTETLPAS